MQALDARISQLYSLLNEAFKTRMDLRLKESIRQMEQMRHELTNLTSQRVPLKESQKLKQAMDGLNYLQEINRRYFDSFKVMQLGGGMVGGNADGPRDLVISSTDKLEIYLPSASHGWKSEQIMVSAGEVMEAMGYELTPETEMHGSRIL